MSGLAQDSILTLLLKAAQCVINHLAEEQFNSIYLSWQNQCWIRHQDLKTHSGTENLVIVLVLLSIPTQPFENLGNS